MKLNFRNNWMGFSALNNSWKLIVRRKTIAFGMIVMMTFCGSYLTAQQRNDSLNRVDAKGMKQGNWMKRDMHGLLIYTGTFINDQPTGKFIYYYPNTTKIKSITRFDAKKHVAYTTVFTPEGKRKVQGKVVGELKDSTWTYFDAKDSVIAVENYKLGKKDGAFITYLAGKTMIDLKTYKDDELNGPYAKYYDNGQLREEGSYLKGLHNGHAKFYSPSGNLNLEGDYQLDFKYGVWDLYSNAGILEWKITYRHSEVVKSLRYNGLDEQFYGNGIPKSRIVYKDGLKNGPFTEFYEKGQVVIETVPAHDQFPEDKKQTFSGVQISREGNYFNDKLNGKVTYYKEDGSVDKVENYKMGLLVTEQKK